MTKIKKKLNRNLTKKQLGKKIYNSAGGKATLLRGDNTFHVLIRNSQNKRVRIAFRTIANALAWAERNKITFSPSFNFK